MTHFFSCDWGTSSFRLRLVEVEDLNVIKEVTSDQGIAGTFNLWEEKGIANKEKKREFYLNVIQEHIRTIENSLHFSLEGSPVLISGMASSSIGIEELPYGDLPFKVDGSNAISACFGRSNDFQHDLFLISGVRKNHDVMRGEETQLVGAFDLQQEIKNDKTETEKIFVFPGTHSKHLFIKDGQITDFKTFMTGEYFDLLRNKSILSLGVADVRNFQSPQNMQSFKRGVTDSLTSNLLNATFSVRTNHLFGYLTKEENCSYLSGLLIGAELQDLISLTAIDTPIYLCGSSSLQYLYQTAILEIGLKDNLQRLPFTADDAVVNGQLKIYKNFMMNNELNNE